MAFSQLTFMHANRCLRVVRLFGIISMFSKEPDTNKLHLTAFKVFSIMVLCIQASACFWFHQVCEPTYAGNVRYCPKAENWLQLLPEFSTNSTGITDMEFYATTLYWSTITLCSIGYGDIHATNLEEATAASFVMVLGLLSFGISMSNMSSVITNMVAQRGRFYHRVDAILHYMRQMELPEEIQEWVHKHYYNLWFHQKGRNIAGLMDDLPFILHSDVLAAVEIARAAKKRLQNFRHPLREACAYGVASVPQNAVFEKDQSINLEVSD
ncbi:potassium channel KAT3-like [Sinocyclocheilus rhinocerous]|uniref:potassium channel KAT3-like n=1 Tax=Sinocyclocheilus rhinocerous TaxID=307959 RepID=UPI0007B9F4A2|nr:PREDICTED: potassium channel KAT3-like [Sinocyclocheilus rhinocerous]